MDNKCGNLGMAAKRMLAKADANATTMEHDVINTWGYASVAAPIAGKVVKCIVMD